jgi:hypothetical protein
VTGELTAVGALVYTDLGPGCVVEVREDSDGEEYEVCTAHQHFIGWVEF